ncbi:MAG: TonB-dependent receptor [Terracidiphilus sp.]
MRQATMRWTIAMGILAVGGSALWAQANASQPTTAPTQSSSPVPAQPLSSTGAATNQSSADTQTPPAPAVTGGTLHGVVKSGNIPLPGVTVTAQNTLTGKKYSTTTDMNGAWSMNIPQNGRYVVRTQFAAFAPGSQEAVLNATSHDQTVTFALMLASRAAVQQQQQAQQDDQQSAQAVIRQLAGNGAQSLSLLSSVAGDTETQAGAPSTANSAGASLPSAANNTDFGGDSVAISGQSGQVSPLAGVDMDRIRDAIETARAQGAIPEGAAGIFAGALGGGGFGGGGFGSGGFGGGGFGGGGFGGGGRGNFRGFNPGQPHGAIFWFGSNSALNAEPFSLQGQPQEQPASGSNRFGITFMSEPYIPHLTKPSGKDTVFLTLSGTRSSIPTDTYAPIPTDAERTGDFSAPGLPAIYDPATGQQFSYIGRPNVIPPTQITSQAKALLNYFPHENLPGDEENYHLLTTAQTNSTQAGVRYLRSLGKNAVLPTGGGRGGGGGGRRNQNLGLRQSISLNYNWSESASDIVNLFPQLGGKSSSDSNSVQAGYTVGYHRVTNIFNANLNRSNSRTTNFFTDGVDVATEAGILGPAGTALNVSSINYGLPNVTLSNLTGLNQQQPSFSLSQTISFSEVLSWIHGKHNLRFGGDYRRVHRDFLGGSNATGSFTFTGLFTEAPGTSTQNGEAATGSAMADFLLGLPQDTSLDSTATKSYLRDNVWDAFAQDDWRVLPSLTLNYGVRYELYEPYTEKYGHLADVDTNPSAAFTGVAEVQAGSVGAFSGRLPDSLVFPFKVAFAPRLGLAYRLPKQTVVRAGFGMNYSVGEYATFASTYMARQPMVSDPTFVNEQTNNVATDGMNNPSAACARAVPITCLTLAQGFPAPDTTGNYALNPHYTMPYVQVWNVDVQKTLPLGIVLNVGYNGSKGNHLDILSAPRATPGSPLTNPTSQVFTYDQAVAFSKLSAGTVRVNKRLSKSIALGANYEYSHSIDDAGSVNGTSSRVVQNWQDPQAEEANSGFDIRHQVSGTYLYELPFGKDKTWVTTGVGSHILEGFSVSGSYTFATGEPLTPTYAASVTNVQCGTAGAGRPDRVPGTSLTAGGGTKEQWFNTGAFATPGPVAGYPCAVFGSASRNSITGPGKITNNMAFSKTVQMGDTRSMEIRATINNAFNTVQYSGVGTSVTLPNFGQVTSVSPMRSFQFTARFRF